MIGPAGRYAPSPTSDLHLGNLRTAVVAWLMARSSGRRFVLRIEDLDTARVRAAGPMALRQQADLDSLGLDFDPPLLRQSDRLDAYAHALLSLADRTYECFCTRREIAEAASAPHGAALRPYPGTCLRLTSAEREARRAVRPPAMRVRAEAAVQTIVDRWSGQVTAVVDDLVLVRNDGTPAYNFAVVVDDLFQGVDQVVRGDDLLASAPRQAWLAEQLGGRAPSYGHVPLVLNESGQRLAKRDGAVTLADLAAEGTSAQDALTTIAVSLGLTHPNERVTPAQLLHRFDPDALPRDPWVYRP
ncbi:MAG: tRNA glutamyl-Q(34) synthetase GluQRS [Micropruina sp.]|nr:tRNA glutamyl-Q(34) synthetase GluQRS [Micropruina sp.]